MSSSGANQLDVHGNSSSSLAYLKKGSRNRLACFTHLPPIMAGPKYPQLCHSQRNWHSHDAIAANVSNTNVQRCCDCLTAIKTGHEFYWGSSRWIEKGFVLFRYARQVLKKQVALLNSDWPLSWQKINWTSGEDDFLTTSFHWTFPYIHILYVYIYISIYLYLLLRHADVMHFRTLNLSCRNEAHSRTHEIFIGVLL